MSPEHRPAPPRRPGLPPALGRRRRAQVLVCSDTHGELDPRVLARAADADLAVHAGDVGSAQVMDQLARRCPVVAVRGNNDVAHKWEGPAASLDGLAEAAHVALPGGVLAVEHGHRAGPAASRHLRLRARHAGARAVVYGHSHRLLIDDATDPAVVNPGAAGRVRTFGGPSYLWLVATSSSWTWEAVRLPPAR